MRNITLSADERLIEAARERARSERTTLNEQFRRWLEEYASGQRPARRTLALLEDFQEYFDTSGPKLTRDEMNDR
ncbi:MAG: hypothetical protein DWG80_03450 [Chloroflexi bacterium]|nr:hypothetical protein [Chloroflexota bacterium]